MTKLFGSVIKYLVKQTILSSSVLTTEEGHSSLSSILKPQEGSRQKKPRAKTKTRKVISKITVFQQYRRITIA